MVPLPKSVSLSNSILLIWLKLHSSYWLEKMNTFQYTPQPVQYIIQIGVLHILVTKQIFFSTKKTIFTSEQVIYTDIQWQSNLFLGKICKNLFRQGAILHFQYYLLNFLPIFQNKFLTIVNAIYILYEAKIGVKLGCFFATEGSSDFAEILFSTIF